VNKLNDHLENQLRALKLKGLITCFKELSERAVKSSLSYEEYLSLLLEEEIKRKNEGTVKTKINKARFPFLKTLEEFEYKLQHALKKKEIDKIGSQE